MQGWGDELMAITFRGEDEEAPWWLWCNIWEPKDWKSSGVNKIFKNAGVIEELVTILSVLEIHNPVFKDRNYKFLAFPKTNFHMKWFLTVVS